MGYYSSYEIIVDDPDQVESVLDWLNENTGGYRFEFFGDSIVSEDVFKWYDHAKDLVRCSLEHPGLLLTLRGIGEDSERWQIFAKDGKSYEQNVTPGWPEFDEDRMS